MKYSVLSKCAAALLLTPVLHAAEDRPNRVDDVDPKEWGIQSDCIRINRINSIKFIDEQTALIDIPQNKTILMKLKGRCPGVKHYGITYKTSTGALCARMDFVTSLQTKFHCQIESFEPYPTLDEPSGNDADEETDSKTDKKSGAE